MRCPECATDNPDVAAFCLRCGHGLRGTDASPHGRGNSYVVQSAERVTQFALISSIMPHTNRKAADNYRWAFLITGAIVLIFTLTGAQPAAILAGASLVPVVYLFYLYDVNLWRDSPIPVVMSLFVGTGMLATLISLVFFHWIFDGQFQSLLLTRAGIGGLDFGALMIFAVLLPIVAEVAKNVGPISVITKLGFDDMIDGVTFGIAAGTAYAAFETIVAFGPVFTGTDLIDTQGLATWFVIVLNLMIVKPLIYGTATGIAVGAYSGRGEGYDGLTPAYYTNFAFAVGMNILYWLGVRLLSFATYGQALSLMWGIAIAAVLILRMRVMLHTALLEAAVEDAAQGRRSKAATTDGGYCPECEMGLLPDALFCIVCGESVRATSEGGRRHIREPLEGSFRA